MRPIEAFFDQRVRGSLERRWNANGLAEICEDVRSRRAAAQKRSNDQFVAKDSFKADVPWKS